MPAVEEVEAAAGVSFVDSLVCCFVCLFVGLLLSLSLSCCSFGGRRWKCQRVAVLVLRPPRAFSFRLSFDFFFALPDNSIIALALLGGSAK